MKISVIHGDITKQEVDVIVNAANESLLGGGGVDGAIHRAAGAELLRECRQIGGCKTGQAVMTKGYKLPAKHVIHTVGPIWRAMNEQHDLEEKQLAYCYKNTLKMASENGLKTIAFPAISTGAYGFPAERATEIAIREVKEFMENDNNIEEVVFVCYEKPIYELYMKSLKWNPSLWAIAALLLGLALSVAILAI